MSITTYHTIKCNCGYTGKIKVRENDTVYSSSGSWQSFSLVDLVGGNHSTQNKDIHVSEAIKYLKPICLNCFKELTDENIID